MLPARIRHAPVSRDRAHVGTCWTSSAGEHTCLPTRPPSATRTRPVVTQYRGLPSSTLLYWRTWRLARGGASVFRAVRCANRAQESNQQTLLSGDGDLTVSRELAAVFKSALRLRSRFVRLLCTAGDPRLPLRSHPALVCLRIACRSRPAL